MTEEDMFFTHTIVGSALSFPLGTHSTHAVPGQTGLLVNMRDASTSIDQAWKDWLLVQGAYPYIGRPRPAPGALRRSIARHALLIAALGLLLSVAALAAMAWVAYPSIFRI